MSDSTLTRYLKLKVAADLSADAKYNLNRIDSLGFLATVNDDDSLNLVARGDIDIEPKSPDVGGTGINGTINLGVSRNPATDNIDVISYARSFLVRAGFKLLNSTSAVSPSTTKSLEIKYTSADNAADRVLTVDVDGANRSLSIEDSGRVVTIDENNSNSSIEELTGLTTPLSVAQGGTGSSGPANDPHALDNLVPVYTAAERGFALAVDPAGEENGLIWREFEAGGTVTNVTLDVDSVSTLFTLATPTPQPPGGTATGPNQQIITTAGTFALLPTSQLANKVYASPNGSSGVPTFRSLVKADLPALTTTDIAEGTNQYFTEARAQSAVVVQVLSSIDLTHSPSSSAVITQLNLKENTITAGTSSQYWRGDKVWSSPVTSDINDALQTQAPDCTAVKNYVSAQVGAGMFTFDWLAGNSTDVSHNFGTQDVMVSIYDKATFEEIYVDSVVRTDTSKVTLTSSTAPSGSGWRVLVRK